MKFKATKDQVNQLLKPFGIIVKREKLAFGQVWKLQQGIFSLNYATIVLDNGLLVRYWLEINQLTADIAKAKCFRIIGYRNFHYCRHDIQNPYAGAKSLEEMEIRKDLLGTGFAV